MLECPERVFTDALDLREAVTARAEGAEVIAGGTWLMRNPRRGIALPRALVNLAKVPEYIGYEITSEHVFFGAGMTHEALASAAHGIEGFKVLALAAQGAANPAIRRVATLGGNLCSTDFHAADLVPALLALDSRVELFGPSGKTTYPLEAFLQARTELLQSAILLRVIVPKSTTASTHIRLPLRKAGDYPVAIVSVAVADDGEVRVAVGSVEPVARRWRSLEVALATYKGLPDPPEAEALAKLNNDFEGRDGIEAEGWYRRQVLPTLLRRAIAALQTEGAAA